MNGFADMVAIVTGSTSGIGRAVARELHAEGAMVILNSRRSAEAGMQLADEMPGSRYVQADVAERSGAAALVAAAIDQGDRLDLLVNCAGGTLRIAHDDMDAVSDDVWSEMLRQNLLGAWHMIQESVPVMLRGGGGRIVNVSSMAGVTPMGSSVPYAAMKAALNHSTALLAKALGPQIVVNAVAPGLTATPWTAEWSEDHCRVAQAAPLRRVAQPHDIAAACTALLRLDHVTGVVLPVDGGMHLL